MASSLIYNKLIALPIIPFGKICFITFIAISTYFLIDSSFKFERFLMIWLQILFYSVLFTVVSFYFNKSISLNEWISVFFPITGNVHGFASVYLALYLLLPFLLKVARSITLKQLNFLLFVLVYFEVVSKILGNFFNYNPLLISNELTLFVLCFFISLRIKRYNISSLFTKLSFVIPIFLLLYFLICLLLGLNVFYPKNNFFSRFLISLIADETSFLIIIAGYFLFFIFKSIKIPCSKVINSIASVSFAVLLVHDHNFFRYILWHKLLKSEYFYNSKYYLLWIIGSVMLIYCFCGMIDFVRKRVEKIVFSRRTVKLFIIKIENLIEAR